jgi:hypothetical protein
LQETDAELVTRILAMSPRRQWAILRALGVHRSRVADPQIRERGELLLRVKAERGLSWQQLATWVLVHRTAWLPEYRGQTIGRAELKRIADQIRYWTRAAGPGPTGKKPWRK